MQFKTSGRTNVGTGFPKKDARFSKLKNVSGLLSDNKKGKIMEFQFQIFSNRVSFMGNPVSPCLCCGSKINKIRKIYIDARRRATMMERESGPWHLNF